MDGFGMRGWLVAIGIGLVVAAIDPKYGLAILVLAIAGALWELAKRFDRSDR